MARIDLSSPPSGDEPEAYAALRRYLAGEGALPAPLDGEAIGLLVDALVKRGEAERLGQLAASRDKAIAKPARRGIHLLRTRGVDAQIARPAETGAARPAAEAEPETDSLITAPQRDGEMIVWYSFSTPSGRVDICQASITELAGLTRFEMYRTSRKKWRSVEREIVAETNLLVTRVPPAYARWLIEEGNQRAMALGKNPPREYAEARASLETPVAVERHPGLDVASEEEVRAISDPERALELPEARSWIPDEASVRALLDALDKLRESPLILDERQQAERRDALIRRTAAEAMTGGLRARLSRRLLDAAYFVTRASLAGPKNARDYAADAALAVAGAWHMEDESVDAADNRIARRLYVRVMDRLRKPEERAPEEEDEGGGGGGGLLVTP